MKYVHWLLTLLFAGILWFSNTMTVSATSTFPNMLFLYANNNLYAYCNDAEIKNTNVVVVNSANMQVIENTVITETYFSTTIPQNTEKIEVFWIPHSTTLPISTGYKYSIEFCEMEKLQIPYVVDKIAFSGNLSNDFIAPYVQLYQTFDNTVITQNSLLLSGTCINANKLYINNVAVGIDKNGNFSFDKSLEIGENFIDICAINQAGNEFTLKISVTRKPTVFSILIIFSIIYLIALLFSAKKKKHRIAKIKSSILFVFSSFALFTVVLKNTVVTSSSMEPTLMTNKCAVYNQLAYKFTDIQRGDIICYWSREYNAVFSKRVIGLAGDKISFQNGYIFINNTKLDESEYLNKEVKTYCSKSFVVPEGCIFVLGDNRENSIDSRFFKQPYINTEDIYGKYICSYPNFIFK